MEASLEAVPVRLRLHPETRAAVEMLADRSGLSTERVIVDIVDLWMAEQRGAKARQRKVSPEAKKLGQIIEVNR